jgi:hypothetical protein
LENIIPQIFAVAQFEISDSPREGVIPKAGVLQPAEGSCVVYPGFAAREIPHCAWKAAPFGMTPV